MRESTFHIWISPSESPLFGSDFGPEIFLRSHFTGLWSPLLGSLVHFTVTIFYFSSVTGIEASWTVFPLFPLNALDERNRHKRTIGDSSPATEKSFSHSTVSFPFFLALTLIREPTERFSLAHLAHVWFLPQSFFLSLREDTKHCAARSSHFIAWLLSRQALFLRSWGNCPERSQAAGSSNRSSQVIYDPKLVLMLSNDLIKHR